MSFVYPTRLAYREWIAHETLAIQIERPEGLDFLAGQYVDLTLRNAQIRDPQGPARSLSIASAPGAELLEFVMRMRNSAFKRTLAEVPIGTELLVEGPFDDLRLRRALERGRELVFLAGGMGIAPFMSVLREAAEAGRSLPATLFYSNRRPEDAAYLAELQRLEQEIDGFRLVATMTRMNESARSWSGAVERLSAGLLGRFLPSVVGPAYYLAGAPFFISQLRAALLGAGVPDLDIGIEMYGGY